MGTSARTSQVHKFFLAIWAMATLVLLFCVGLFALELLERGEHPLPPVERVEPSAQAEPEKERTASEARQVTLYFASPDGSRLAPETRSIDGMGAYTQDNCRKVLEALISGPQGDLAPILPPTSKLRGVFLLESGELVVDFSQELRTDATRPRSAHAEAMMVYGLVNTIAQQEVLGDQGGGVRQVRFMFYGSPADDTFPEHMDLSSPVKPDPQWQAAAAGPMAHGR